MKNLIIALFLVVGLTGCLEEFDDGYQFGDLTRSIIAYCDENSNDILRQFALEKIHDKYPNVPEEGICEHVR